VVVDAFLERFDDFLAVGSSSGQQCPAVSVAD